MQAWYGRRPAVALAYGNGDKSADFRCFFSGTVGESVLVCAAREGLVPLYGMNMSALGLSQLEITGESFHYTHSYPMIPYKSFPGSAHRHRFAHCATEKTAKISRLVTVAVRQGDRAGRRPYHACIALGPRHQYHTDSP